jgi:hypothetical protein
VVVDFMVVALELAALVLPEPSEQFVLSGPELPEHSHQPM